MIRFYENNRLEYFLPGPTLEFDTPFINPTPHLGYAVFRGPRIKECFFPVPGKPHPSGLKNLYPHTKAYILTADFRAKEIVVDIDVRTPWGFIVEIRKMSFPLCLSIPTESPGIRKWKEFVSTLNFEPKKHIPYLEELFYHWVKKRILKGILDFPSCLEALETGANQNELETVFKEHLLDYLSRYDGKEFDTFAPEVFSPITYVDVEHISAPGFKNYIRSLIKLSAKANCLSFYTRDPNDLPMSIFKAFCRHPRKVATFIDDPNIPECFYSVALFNLMNSPSVDSQIKNSAKKSLTEWFCVCVSEEEKIIEETLEHFQSVETLHLYLELLKQKSRIVRYLKIGGSFYIAFTNSSSIPFRFFIDIVRNGNRYEVFKQELYNPLPNTDDISDLFGDDPKAALFVILERCDLVTTTPSTIPNFSPIDAEYEKRKRDYDSRSKPPETVEGEESNESIPPVVTEPESSITVADKPGILRFVYALLLLAIIVIVIIFLITSKINKTAKNTSASETSKPKSTSVETHENNYSLDVSVPHKTHIRPEQPSKAIKTEIHRDNNGIKPSQGAQLNTDQGIKQTVDRSANRGASVSPPNKKQVPSKQQNGIVTTINKEPGVSQSSTNAVMQQKKKKDKPVPSKTSKQKLYKDDPLPRPIVKDYSDEPLPRPGGSK